MRIDELLKYYFPALKSIMGEMNEATIKTLDEMLGLPKEDQGFDGIIGQQHPCSEDAKKLYTLLAGPHGNTILKIHRIQKGLEKSDDNG